MRHFLTAATLLLTAGCVSTDVTQLSRNEFLISTSAAPVCRTGGARRVVARMAAVETIRNGYDRFVIRGAQSENNVTATPTAPTTAYTTGQATTYGNTTYGSATTTYGGGGVMYSGSHDANLHVVMLRQGDRGYEDGVDARDTLGPEWERLVREGIRTCG